jgi:hypothetical protein
MDFDRLVLCGYRVMLLLSLLFIAWLFFTELLSSPLEIVR